ncbi:MAG TPA: Crp/Fnr family transcriptional regulator [Novosphingobium sp.]|nr:Crp/Fnr family transcriptional regulator [Novosphingobium sp.]
MAIGEVPILTAEFDLYRWLPDQARAAFSAVVQRRNYSAGRLIYLQADEGHEMFRLIEGEVRLSVMRGNGRELIYLLFKPGDCFGPSSLIDGGRRPHTTEAQTDVTVDTLSRENFQRLRQDHPEFNEALLRLFCAHMRVLSRYVADAALDELPTRLAGRLLAAACMDASGVRTVRLRQAELGRMIGASRQTINRLLQKFRDDGLVELSYSTVEIIDEGGLKRVALAE